MELMWPLLKKTFLTLSRTVARSRQLEVEERAGLRNSASRNVDFADSPDRAATATLLRDDQLDFHDNDTTDQGQYLDEFTDDEDTNFAFGGSDEEETIGLDRQPPRR